MAPTMTATHPITEPRSRLAGWLALLGRVPLSVHLLLFRLAVASVFFKAGMTKWASWESTVALFAEEYKVPVLAPATAAVLATTVELGCSTLLALGLVTRGGTINEFIGDAIFAVFGAPLPHADHAERAAGAALAMQHAMADINREHEARGLPPFAMGIGVNTGEAVVGNIGSEQRAKYAVVGSAVNVAARVESATVGGQVFVTAATHERIRDIAEVAPPVTVAVKGLAEPLQLYELQGLPGRFAQARDPRSADADRAVDVAWPVTCWVIEEKIVRGETLAGTVTRLGRHRLAVRLDAVLPPLTNVRLRLDYTGSGRSSDDVYGKVLGDEPGDGRRLTRIHLTSVTDADRKVLDDVRAAAGRTP